MIVGVIIASEGRGTKGECEFENQIYRKKCVITPYKCHGRVAENCLFLGEEYKQYPTFSVEISTNTLLCNYS